MKKTILVIGIACASLMAAAQSNDRQDQYGQANGVTSPRDHATGQASGKRMHKPMTMTMADGNGQAPAQDSVQTAREASSGMATGRSSVQAPRDSASGMATGKTMASDDWQAQQKTKGSMSGAQSNPMYKDEGKSGVNPLYQGNQRTATKTRSNIQNNRVATGDVDGDGMADGAVVKSKSNITNNRVAAGDVNGDGKADAAVSPAPPAQMKGDFSRGPQPDRKTPAATSTGTARETGSGMATGKRQHD